MKLAINLRFEEGSNVVVIVLIVVVHVTVVHVDVPSILRVILRRTPVVAIGKNNSFTSISVPLKANSMVRFP